MHSSSKFIALVSPTADNLARIKEWARYVPNGWSAALVLAQGGMPEAVIASHGLKAAESVMRGTDLDLVVAAELVAHAYAAFGLRSDDLNLVPGFVSRVLGARVSA